MFQTTKQFPVSRIFQDSILEMTSPMKAMRRMRRMLLFHRTPER
jgi:hypothetical protein